MSRVNTNTWPSHRATPRLATIPKLRKTATLSGVQRHFTLPVVASSAQTLSSFVVTYRVPFASTGYDCSPRRTLASIVWKSTVKLRPSWSTFPGVISVSGECRISSGVLPKPPQPTSAPASRRADADASMTQPATARRSAATAATRAR